MTLVVINPNSSDIVTRGIEAALAPFAEFGPPIRCLTLAEGPAAIESQAEADLTIAPMLALAASQEDATGFVIACFGDPGLHALRDRVAVPVVGIQEAAVLTALSLGQRFGVISILAASVPRHLRAFGAMGVMDRLAGDRPIGRGVADLAEAAATSAAMIDTGRLLRDADGADVLVMGCAGMAGYRAEIEAATGLPVVEPCQAAAGLALSQIGLGYRRKERPA
ncbi:MAG: aspartate/glutamate racemase family protein [Paracoccaceae bacterium]|nr:aspartate/glutamate racemase family protein [Paracoccaceae bacterium]